MNDYVELTPAQAITLIKAWKAEQDRVRHEAEGWEGQYLRDVKRRDALIETAVITQGVPHRQVHRFVYHEEEGE